MKVKLISCTPDPIQAMAEAAATCTDSEPSAAVVRKCLESGHLSIAEFAQFHFLVTGISRAASHQLVRKRIASYAQRSQRYCAEDGFQACTPDSIAEHEAAALWLYSEFMDYAAWTYEQLLEHGIPKEDARFVLPNACETQIHVAMNGHALIDFCNQRTCSRAQWEIRDLAYKMRIHVVDQCFMLADYMGPKCVRLGYCPEKDGCGAKPTKEEALS